MFRAALLASISWLLAGCGDAARLEVVSDACLNDPQKVEPGLCGCGVDEGRCAPLLLALRHRYAFDGVGDVAVDDVGGRAFNGAIVNTALMGTGRLDLDRESELEQYVELPNGIVSSLLNATFEGWVVWQPPPEMPRPFWERIFDFGVSMAGENQRDHGRSYLFFAPGTPGSTPPLSRTAFRDDALGEEVVLDATQPFPTSVETHFAVVVDVASEKLHLYVNAVELAEPVTLTEPLSAIDDVNNWLGRSQFAVDTRFGGSFLEFRIYDQALTQQQLADSLALGPSPAFLRPPAHQDATSAP
jgi:hypothetical protein